MKAGIPFVRLTIFGLVAIPCLSPAGDGFLGTKLDSVAPPPSAGTPLGIMPIVQMVVALVVVLGLIKWILPKIAAKASKRLTTGIDSPIRIEESAAFGGGHLYVVTVRGKTLLLSAAGTNVACLTDLTDAVAKDKAALGREFFDTLTSVENAMTTVSEPVQEPSNIRLPDERSTVAALERLQRLVG